MQIRDLMNPNVVTVEPGSTAALASRLLSRHNVGVLPVCSGDKKLRGMVTDRDIVLRCVAAEEDPAQTQVKDIMTRRPAVVSPESDCRAAAQMMARHQVRRLPVVEGEILVGIVSLCDLVHSSRMEMEAAQALSEITENILRGKR
jgi:CBS domain-containing protein